MESIAECAEYFPFEENVESKENFIFPVEDFGKTSIDILLRIEGNNNDKLKELYEKGNFNLENASLLLEICGKYIGDEDFLKSELAIEALGYCLITYKALDF